jgi:tRNA(fMet)-specific endonuclease VapC
LSEPLRILDTDHISLHQRGDKSVLAHSAALDPALLAVTVVSLEESMRGWLATIRRAQDATALDRSYRYLYEGWNYYRKRQVLPFEGPAVWQYLQLRQTLKQVGPRDLKIAAIVLAQGSILVTRNRQDFGQVPGLVIEDWTRP